MLNVAVFNSVYNLVRHAKHCIVPEACCHFFASVNACKASVLSIAAKLQSLLYNRGKVLVISYMHQFRIRHKRCCEHSVRIACFWRHQAVCSKQHRRRNVFKFFLLILPCSTEIPFEMRIFFQLRISVRRQHFTMSVNIDALTLGLLKQQFQVVQIMSRNNDKRSFFNF